MSKPEQLISVDVETGGPVPILYPLLAIGACLVEEVSERFYAELRPEAEQVDAFSIEISWPGVPAAETIARLEAEGEDPREALARFAAWVEQVSVGRTPVYVAVNAAFDWAFTHAGFLRAGIEDPFGYAPLDVKSYWAGRARVSLDETRKSKLPDFLSEGLGEHSHRADDDAVRQALMFQRMRAFQP